MIYELAGFSTTARSLTCVGCEDQPVYEGHAVMFIFNRSLWAVGAGLATACAIVAASFLLNRPGSLPASPAPAAASGEAPIAVHPAS
jgi:hypothetical protein